MNNGPFYTTRRARTCWTERQVLLCGREAAYPLRESANQVLIEAHLAEGHLIEARLTSVTATASVASSVSIRARSWPAWCGWGSARKASRIVA